MIQEIWKKYYIQIQITTSEWRDLINAQMKDEPNRATAKKVKNKKKLVIIFFSSCIDKLTYASFDALFEFQQGPKINRCCFFSLVVRSFAMAKRWKNGVKNSTIDFKKKQKKHTHNTYKPNAWVIESAVGERELVRFLVRLRQLPFMNVSPFFLFFWPENLMKISVIADKRSREFRARAYQWLLIYHQSKQEVKREKKKRAKKQTRNKTPTLIRIVPYSKIPKWFVRFSFLRYDDASVFIFDIL